MNSFLKTLRARLILWYVGSIAFFTLFFYIFVHKFNLPHSTHIYELLFLVFSILGIILIYRITKSLTYLSNRIRHISRKNLDERILNIKSEDEIGELASSFNSLLDDLHEAFKREQQFIGDVAHELKTPLATMRSSVEVALTKDRSKEEYKKILQNILEETDNMSSTVKNVLDLAWAETYSERKQASIVDLSALMEELCDITEKMAKMKKITVESSISHHVLVEGYKDKLARALLNLLDNAVKYTPHNGSISIALHKSHEHAFIEIKDTGIGIAEEDIPHIFDRFFRGSKTDKILGSGLGLAIAKSLITLHRGSIRVESKQKKGTKFTIILPLATS